MTWSLSKKTIILPSTLMKCLWNVNVRNEKTAPSPGEADSFSCWFFVGAVKRVKLWNTSSLLKTKTSRCFACKAPRPKSLIHKSQGAMILQKKNWGFLGIRVIFTPKLWGNDPIFEEHIFQRETWSHQLVLYRFSCGATPGEKNPHCWKVFSKVTKLWQFNNNDRVPTDVVSWWPKNWCWVSCNYNCIAHLLGAWNLMQI